MRSLFLSAILATVSAQAATTQLIVTGEPGYGQSLAFRLLRCAATGAGLPERFSCRGESFERALNVASPVEPGLYRLEYSRTFLFVRIAEGVTRRVRLGESGEEGRGCLVDSALVGGTRFRVFRDFSADEETRKELLDAWTQPARERRAENLCKLGHPNARALCAAWSGSDPLALRWSLGIAGRDAVFMDELGRFPAPTRTYVSGAVPCGERVAVLPGVYAVENVSRAEIRTGFRVSAKGESYYAPPPTSLEIYAEGVSRGPKPEALSVVTPSLAIPPAR